MHPNLFRIIAIVIVAVAIAIHIVAAIVIPGVGVAISVIVARGFIPRDLAIIIGLAVLIVSFAAAVLAVVALTDRITDQTASDTADSRTGDTVRGQAANRRAGACA
jgi:hypothetical protein